MDRIFVMTALMCTTNTKGNVKEYRVLSVPNNIYPRYWLEWLIMARNSYKISVREAVCHYVETIAVNDAYELPVHVRKADGQYFDAYLETNPMIVLNPQHSITLLYDGFIEKTVKHKSVDLNNFRDILKTVLLHIRVSLRTRGICDTLFCVSRECAHSTCL